MIAAIQAKSIASQRQIAQELNCRGIRTARGKDWLAGQAHALLAGLEGLALGRLSRPLQCCRTSPRHPVSSIQSLAETLAEPLAHMVAPGLGRFDHLRPDKPDGRAPAAWLFYRRTYYFQGYLYAIDNE